MIILDTNVVSELMRTNPDPTVAAWLAGQDRMELRTTTITVAEVGTGIARLPHGQRRNMMAQAAGALFTQFAGAILAFDLLAAASYARVVSSRLRAGLHSTSFDAAIAAIALSRSAGLATRNARDFEATGVVVLNPFAGG